LSQLLAQVTIFPQVLLNIKFKAGYNWTLDEAIKSQIAKVENELQGVGRVLIRASGTERVLRVMAEAENSEVAMKAAQSIASFIPTT